MSHDDHNDDHVSVLTATVVAVVAVVAVRSTPHKAYVAVEVVAVNSSGIRDRKSLFVTSQSSSAWLVVD